MKIIHFQNNTSKPKQKNIHYLKDFLKNDGMSFFEYLNFKTLMKIHIY
jgi:hypothetical protein